MALLIAEYGSLRAEILKLIELQSQLQTLAIIAFGTTLSVGFQTESAVVMLIQPALSLLLGASWLNHAHAIHRIAAYLSGVVERRVGPEHLAWETYVRAHPLSFGRPGYWATRSVFIVSSALSVVVGSLIADYDAVEIAVLALSATAALATSLMFFFWQEAPIPLDSD
ncbi:hypothetical protein ACIHCQ_26330 [Streptomyces sp. NPDC052236]|uniref:hypothetical protein n=1 Tax=Streptomyces sp. NPDC052236 TaxID=3365686 RepID=UPI0037D54F97